MLAASVSVLTKKPISPTVSPRSRFADGTPIRIPVSPLARASSVASAASSTANGVARRACASARMRRASSADMSNAWRAPLAPRCAGRVAAPGSSSASRLASSVARQYASWRSPSPASSQRRCQSA
ncbi:putative pyoverdine sidechain peptide synthetase [Burkholderia pseudomallei]|nr:putative pyoverdine sidechain peptide synthetase [Burkholderia pseudomallei]